MYIHAYIHTCLPTYVYLQALNIYACRHSYIHTCLPANIHDFRIFGFPDFHIYAILVFPEIQKYEKWMNSYIKTYLHTYVQTDSCMSLYVTG